MSAIFKKLKSCSGFSIVEVLIAAGMMGAIALLISQMTSNQMRAVRSISSIIDRDSLQSNLTVFFASPNYCSMMLGAGKETYDFGAVANPPVSTLQDPTVIGSTLLTSNKLANGAKLYVEQMSLQPLGTPIPIGNTERRDVNLVIPLQKSRTGNGVNITNNTGGNVSVGGDNLTPVTIRLNVVTDNTSHQLISCSQTNSNGCTAIGSVAVTTATGTACQVVACSAGTFNAGVYAQADSSGHNAGDAVCCANGTHVAGTFNGTPQCCNAKEYLNASGQCVPPTGPSLCPAGTGEMSRSSDGSAVCCRSSTYDNPSSNTVYASCSANEWMLNASGGCGNNNFFEYSRYLYNGAEMGTGTIPHPATGIEGVCSQKDPRVYLTCCQNISATFVVAPVAPPAPTPDPNPPGNGKPPTNPYNSN